MKRALLALAIALAACPGPEEAPPDAGKPPLRPDASSIDPFADAGVGGEDAGQGGTVGWCNLQSPAAAAVKKGRALAVFGQVFSAGATDRPGAGAGIAGQVGFGPEGSDPRTGAWTWADAGFNRDEGTQNDEYRGEVEPPAVGRYAYAYRFRTSGGEPLYCDLDGNDGSVGGFNPQKLGLLEVKEEGVDWCKLQFPPSAQLTVGEKLSAFGRVLVEGVTKGAGAGEGVEGEIGYGPAGTDGSGGASGWTWVRADYNAEDGDNDEYRGELSPGVGEYAFAFRFQYQKGAWTYCDLNGSDDGYGVAQQGSLKVTQAQPPRIEWCALQFPPTASARQGRATEVFGQVLATRVTNAQGQGAGIVGEAGFGPEGSDPTKAPGWSWVPATFHKDQGNNDEYKGSIVPANAGNYAYAYRFRMAGGEDVYCDLDGNDLGANPFSAAKLGKLEVTAPAVDWCRLTFPHEASLETGAALVAYGQAFLTGVTDKAGQGADIEAQLGIGPSGSDGSATPDGWTWEDAAFEKDDGFNDEYRGSVTPKSAGSWAYAFRFRHPEGPWTYCDRDSTDNGYAAAAQGALIVAAAKPPAVDWCRLQFPASATATAGQPFTAYGQVYVAGVTGAAGKGSGIDAELGRGPKGSDPTAAGAGWTWEPASFNKDDHDNDEYLGSFTPAAAGELGYTFRFRYGSGDWKYCDTNGSQDGYQAASLGALTVVASKPPAVDWCRLQHPATGQIAEGASFKAYGRVYVANVTGAAGKGAGVTGELGYGPVGSDATSGTGWSWEPAAYNVDDGPNDEYSAEITPDAGSWAYAFRFKHEAGDWLYCDLDGNGAGLTYSAAQQGALTVKAAPPPTIDWCNLETAGGRTIEGTPFAVLGQVWKGGVTEGAGKGAGIEGEIGYGPAGTDGATAAGWRWSPAAYHADVSNNDQYRAELGPAVGTYAFGLRFRYQGGPWKLCDLDGSNNGFDKAQQGALTVSEPAGPWVQLRPVSPFENAGASTLVAAEVFLAGVTDKAGQGAGITAEVGHGPKGTLPVAGWTWSPAAYLGDAKGGGSSANDVYGAWMTVPAAGEHDVAVKFTSGGRDWFADLDGGTPYSVAEAARLVSFSDQGPNGIPWCNLQHPAATSAAAGGTSELVYGRVWSPGVTDNPGQGTAISGQLGWGPTGSDARTGPWTWLPAAFNVDAGNNDEYKAALSAPSAPGTYRYAYRFRMGGAWSYCDKDGTKAEAPDQDPFEPENSGLLTVTQP